MSEFPSLEDDAALSEHQRMVLKWLRDKIEEQRVEIEEQRAKIEKQRVEIHHLRAFLDDRDHKLDRSYVELERLRAGIGRAQRLAENHHGCGTCVGNARALRNLLESETREPGR